MTKFVGVKEFRQNMAKLADEIRKKRENLIILKHNTPILKVEPLSEEDINRTEFFKGIEAAIEDVEKGRVYTLEEVKDHLGIE